ncbi:MAG: hypothetical protein V1843_00875 [bacterium]
MRLQNISLTFEIFRENGHFIAYCKALDLTTQGKTFDEVKRRFEQLVPVFINDLKERGTLDEVLSELGWQRTMKNWVAPLKVGEIMEEVRIPCPAA